MLMHASDDMNMDAPAEAAFAINMDASDDLNTLNEYVDVHNLKHPSGFGNRGSRRSRHGRGNLIHHDAYSNLEDDNLKVSSRSRPNAVAGAIAGAVRSQGRADVQVIGAGATNQAVKAIAIARDYLLDSGLDIVVVPSFIGVQIEDEERTAIRLAVEVRTELQYAD